MRVRSRALIDVGVSFGRDSAKTAVSSLEFNDGGVHVGLGEVRPEDGGEIELAVGALPQEIVRQALLAARADDEIGVGEKRTG